MNRITSSRMATPQLAAGLVIAALVGGCDDAVAPPSLVPTTITVSPASAALQSLGETVQLAATVRDQNGHAMSGATVAWASGDTSVATVDASGLVTAVANGIASVTATSGSASGTAAVTVEQVLARVAVDPAADTLLAFGDTLWLTAEALDANGSAVGATGFVWTSSDPSIATVDSVGMVTGVSGGEAEIKALLAGIEGRAQVKVVAVPEVSVAYVNMGKPTDGSTGITDDTIKVSFDSRIAYINPEGWQPLAEEALPDMLQVTTADGRDVLDLGVEYHLGFDVVDEASQLTLTLSRAYPVGDYRVAVKNYAAESDANWIVASGNVAQYLAAAREQSSFTAVRTDLCSRGVAGYFDLTYDHGFYECVKLPNVEHSFTAEGRWESDVPDGDPATTITMTFDSEVVFLDDAGTWSEITNSKLLEMLEIKLNGAGSDLAVPDGPIGRNQVSMVQVEGRTDVTINPPQGIAYAPGKYTAAIRRYARKDDVVEITRSNSIKDYLDSIVKTVSFSIVARETLCARGDAGYFTLTSADETDECIRLPDVRYTFTPRGGWESRMPLGDPTTTIRVRFDSDVVFLDDSGNWRDVTPQGVLEMVDLRIISSRHITEDVPIGEDLVRPGGPIGLEQVSVTSADGGTVLTIEPPDGGYYPWLAVWRVLYDLTLGKYAKREDVSKIVDSESLHLYLEAAKILYVDDNDSFWTNNWGTSCDVKVAPSARSQSLPIPFDRRNDSLVCGTSELRLPEPPPHNEGWLAFDPVDVTPRADPNRTYVIDVAFVTSRINDAGAWKTYLQRDIIPRVNGIYRNSGVNVEFRVAEVIPFAEYRDSLLCPVEDLDVLSSEGTDVLRELVPRIQRDHGVDLVYGLFDSEAGVGGSANIRLRWHWRHHAAYWASVGHVNTMYYRAPTLSEPPLANMAFLVETLAHELGHNLGLRHDKTAVISYPAFNRYHRKGYGYKGMTAGGVEYGTIMSYSSSRLPFFSRARASWRSELCDDDKRHDNVAGIGFCPENEAMPDERLTLGGRTEGGVIVDASEALQYAIEDAARYDGGTNLWRGDWIEALGSVTWKAGFGLAVAVSSLLFGGYVVAWRRYGRRDSWSAGDREASGGHSSLSGGAGDHGEGP